MALQFAVKTLEGLAPEVAALYVPDTTHGGFSLDVVEPEAITKALRAEREGRAIAERNARAAESAAATAAIDREKLLATTAERDAAVARATAVAGSVLELHVRAAATAAGLHDAAIADALRAARESFVVSDDGVVTPKNGVPALTAWMEAAKETAPHWFPASGTGGGAQQSSRGGRSEPGSMSRAQFDALSPAQRAAVAREGTIALRD